MAFVSLPNEIIMEIVDNLHKQQDIRSMTLVSRRFHNLFADYLCRFNIKYRKCTALFWAAWYGREPTARKLLHLGADVNKTWSLTTFGQSYLFGGKFVRPRTGVTPLHLAAKKGHLAMVKLLLEVGADPEARTDERWSPLFSALTGRHEKVARTISRYISNLPNCLVDSTEKLTPLHLSCRLGLWRSAQYFLNEGADVDATDVSAWTPLHHALLHGHSHIELSSSRRAFGASRASIHCRYSLNRDEAFETVKLLLKFGANQNLETQPRSGLGNGVTSRECGLNHPDDRVRTLFGECGVNNADDRVRALFFDYHALSSPHHTPKHNQDSLHIGRAWMLPPMSERERDGPSQTDHIDAKCFFNSYHHAQTSDGHQEQREDFDLNSFPSLNSANQIHNSSVGTYISDGPWSSSNISNLIARLSVSNEPEITRTADRSAHSNPFPQLSNHISKHPLEAEASKLWADFRSPKSNTGAGEMVSSSSSSKDPLPETKRAKARGKVRWQPMKL